MNFSLPKVNRCKNFGAFELWGFGLLRNTDYMYHATQLDKSVCSASDFGRFGSFFGPACWIYP